MKWGGIAVALALSMGASVAQAATVEGRLEPRRTVAIGAQVSGPVAEVAVEEGERVAAGDVLARIERDSFQAAVEEAEARVRKAEAVAKESGRELERQKKIYNRGLSSAHDLELAERDAARDRAEVDAAKAAVKRAQVDLRRTRITAPMDGVVLQRKVHPGETVIANLQPPLLFRLAAPLDRLDAVVAVPQDQVGGVNEGDTLDVSFPGLDGRSREGEVVRVARLPGDSEAEEARYPVRVRVANDGGELRPGMKARVTLP